MNPFLTIRNGLYHLCGVTIVFVGMAASQAQASATASDYQQCHQRAAAILSDCLDNHSGAKQEMCWQKSKQANAFCYAHLRASHQPNPEKQAAERKAAQSRAAEQRQ